MERFGQPPKAGQTHVFRPGAYAVLLRDGEVLLTWQGAPHEEFQLPGGGIDPGENPTTALHREVLEETGWRISPPRRLGAFRRFVFMPEYGIQAEKVCHVYMARPIRKLGPPSEPDHAAVWTSPEAAIRLVANDGDRAYLARVLAHASAF